LAGAVATAGLALAAAVVVLVGLGGLGTLDGLVVLRLVRGMGGGSVVSGSVVLADFFATLAALF
jgi:hypothetical protein